MAITLLMDLKLDQVHFTDQVIFKIHAHRRATARAIGGMIKEFAIAPIFRLMDLIP